MFRRSVEWTPPAPPPAPFDLGYNYRFQPAIPPLASGHRYWYWCKVQVRVVVHAGAILPPSDKQRAPLDVLGEGEQQLQLGALLHQAPSAVVDGDCAGKATTQELLAAHAHL